MKMKIVFFVLIACSLMVASTVTYAGVRVAIHGAEIQISSTITGFIAGMAALLIASAGNVFSLRYRKVFTPFIIVFNNRGGQFVSTLLMLFAILSVPAYFSAIININTLVYVIGKSQLSIVDAIFIALIPLYSILMASVMGIRVDMKNNT